MAKQQAPMFSSDDADSIIDLTEIVQKGKPPLVSKQDVDFDSALSDLMGKNPAMKLDETPELEALLSGIDEEAPKQKPKFAEYAEAEEEAQPLTEADDMDSLLTSLEGKNNKHEQPDDEVDSLLDSLMDNLNPPDTSANAGNQEVSEDDLDDLLSSIEQDSKQVAKEEAPAAPKAPNDLDDLLDGLEFAKPELPPKKEAPKDPDDLDALLAGLKGPAPEPAKPEPMQPAPPPAPKVETRQQGTSPESIDALLDGMDFAKPEPAPAPKKEEPKAPADLDDLLSGLDFAAPAPEPKKPAVNPQASPVGSIDDLLAGLDNLAKPASPEPASPEPASPEPAKPEPAPQAPAQDVRGIPDGDFDDLLAGLDATPPKKTPTPAPAPEDKVDFGDLGALLDSPTSKAAGNAAKPAAQPAFNNKDFDDLDAMFAGKATEEKPALSTDPLAVGLRKRDPHMEARAAAAAAADPLSSGPRKTDPLLAPRSAVPLVELEMAKRLPEFTARLDKVEADFKDLQERVAVLESRPAAEPQPSLDAMLAEGSPLCARLMELVRSAMTQELQAITNRMDSTAQTVNSLEGRSVSVESKLSEVAVVAAKALAGSGKPETPGLSAADLAPITERLTTLEGSVVRQSELDVQAERLDALEAQTARINALEEQTAKIAELETLAAQASRMDALEAQASRIEALEAHTSHEGDLDAQAVRLDALEAQVTRVDALEAQVGRVEALEAQVGRVEALEAQVGRVEALEAQVGRIDALEAQTSRIDALDTQVARIDTLEAQVARIDALEAQASHAEALTEQTAKIAHLETQVAKIAELETQLAQVEAKAASAEATLPKAPAVQPETITKLDRRLATLEARPYVPLETIQGAFDQMGDQLNAPLQQFQNRINLLERRLADDSLPQLAGDLLPFMSATIDKAAAASAAKALREELEALMTDENGGNAETSDEK